MLWLCAPSLQTVFLVCAQWPRTPCCSVAHWCLSGYLWLWQCSQPSLGVGGGVERLSFLLAAANFILQIIFFSTLLKSWKLKRLLPINSLELEALPHTPSPSHPFCPSGRPSLRVCPGPSLPDASTPTLNLQPVGLTALPFQIQMFPSLNQTSFVVLLSCWLHLRVYQTYTLKVPEQYNELLCIHHPLQQYQLVVYLFGLHFHSPTPAYIILTQIPGIVSCDL